MNTTTTAPVGEVSVRVVWARPQETPEEIARQVDLFMHGMRERTGISVLTLGTERTPWPRDQAEQAELVSQMKSTEGLARQGDWDGYAFWVRGFTSEAMAVAHVSAGQDHTGDASRLNALTSRSPRSTVNISRGLSPMLSSVQRSRGGIP